MAVNNKRSILYNLLILSLYIPAVIFYGYRVIISLILLIFIANIYQLILQNKKIEKVTYFSYDTLLLLPLILPPALPFYMIIISMIFGITISNVFFGGSKYSIFSPTALSWGFATLSFSNTMNSSWRYPISGELKYISNKIVDEGMTNIDIYGFPILLIFVGSLLLILKFTDTNSAFSFIFGYIILSLVLFSFNLDNLIKDFGNSNLLFTALILIPQKKYSGKTNLGSIISGCIGGFSAFVFRNFSSNPNGFIYSVILYNIISPLIDEIIIKLTPNQRIVNVR